MSNENDVVLVVFGHIVKFVAFDIPIDVNGIHVGLHFANFCKMSNENKLRIEIGFDIGSIVLHIGSESENTAQQLKCQLLFVIRLVILDAVHL